jgi:glucosamine-6-phosphate deaminase
MGAIEIVKAVQLGTINVEIYADRTQMGTAAARAAAEAIHALAGMNDIVTGIFATGASQLDTLDALTRIDGLPWDKVRGFHLDEYVGLPLEHRASFRGYLRRFLTDKVRMQEFNEIDGTAENPEEVCHLYASKLRAYAPQFCLLGIGENGHLAFNDPSIANFNDPLDVKVVPLDAECKEQQVAEGWFGSLQDVPQRAISLTIPTLLRVPKLIVSVPGTRKAKVVRRTLEEPISTACPATILRTHPGVTIYLDQDSAAELGGLIR